MKPQIPIYRAKKTYSDEDVCGLLFKNDYGNLCIQFEIDDEYEKDYSWYEIDPSTLAIHLEGMIDKNGVKIFAGLRVDNATDQQCGDLVKLRQHKGRVVQRRGEIFINSSDSYAFYSNHKDGFISKFGWGDLEVIWIKQ